MVKCVHRKACCHAVPTAVDYVCVPNRSSLLFCTTERRAPSSPPCKHHQPLSHPSIAAKKACESHRLCGSCACVRLSGCIPTAREGSVASCLIGMRFTLVFALCARPFFFAILCITTQSTPSSLQESSSTPDTHADRPLASRPQSGERGVGRSHWARPHKVDSGADPYI